MDHALTLLDIKEKRDYAIKVKEDLKKSTDSKGKKVLETAEGLIKFIDNYIYDAIDRTTIVNWCIADELLKIACQTIEYFIEPYYKEFKQSSKRGW